MSTDEGFGEGANDVAKIEAGDPGGANDDDAKAETGEGWGAPNRETGGDASGAAEDIKAGLSEGNPKNPEL